MRQPWWLDLHLEPYSNPVSACGILAYADKWTTTLTAAGYIKCVHQCLAQNWTCVSIKSPNCIVKMQYRWSVKFLTETHSKSYFLPGKHGRGFCSICHLEVKLCLSNLFLRTRSCGMRVETGGLSPHLDLI